MGERRRGFPPAQPIHRGQRSEGAAVRARSRSAPTTPLCAPPAVVRTTPRALRRPGCRGRPSLPVTEALLGGASAVPPLRWAVGLSTVFFFFVLFSASGRAHQRGGVGLMDAAAASPPRPAPARRRGDGAGATAGQGGVLGRGGTVHGRHHRCALWRVGNGWGGGDCGWRRWLASRLSAPSPRRPGRRGVELGVGLVAGSRVGAAMVNRRCQRRTAAPSNKRQREDSSVQRLASKHNGAAQEGSPRSGAGKQKNQGNRRIRAGKQRMATQGCPRAMSGRGRPSRRQGSRRHLAQRGQRCDQRRGQSRRRGRRGGVIVQHRCCPFGCCPVKSSARWVLLPPTRARRAAR